MFRPAGWSIPLRNLAQRAPDVVRGEWPRLPLPTASREVAELAQALGRAGDDLRAMMDERNLMLAGISHDLRTPMMRLQYAVELLPGTDPELRAGMHRDVEEMDGILGQFIAYARDGRDESNRSLDLAAICRQAVTASGADWQLHVPEQAWLRGRPMALLRALENLVTNALRHGARLTNCGSDGRAMRGASTSSITVRACRPVTRGKSASLSSMTPRAVAAVWGWPSSSG